MKTVIIVMLVLLFLCTFPTVYEAGNVSADSLPRGIMSFGFGTNFPDSRSLDLEYISGMTAYFGWRDIEKEDGVYDFSAIDALAARARAKGKILNIGFYPGSHAPDWIYSRGAKSFSWQFHLKEDQARLRGEFIDQKSPLPWDPVFLEHWKRFITKVAQKYGKDPDVGYISLTGPTIKDLTTGIILQDDGDWKRFVDSGYSHEKLLRAWIEVIDHYETVMPGKRLVLAVGPQRPRSPDVSLPAALLDYIAHKHYQNISFLCVFLNDTWFSGGGGAKRIRDLLQSARRMGFDIGYQMVQSVHRSETWVKAKPIVRSLRDSLSNGISDGAVWIEVWHDDIIDPEFKKDGKPNVKYVDDLKWAQERLLKQH